MSKLSIPALLFMGALVVMSGLIWAASTSGAFLPTVDQQSTLSLRNVASRRSHYMMYNSYGK